MPNGRGIKYVHFNIAVPAGQGVRLFEPTPFAGAIKEVLLHYPAGCNALVGIAVHHGNQQFLPVAGFIALNDTTPVYVCNEDVARGEEIWVNIQNTDGVNPHNITVMVRVDEK